MNNEAEFAVQVLRQYALENSTLPRSTSDLSPMEEWLILQLFAITNKDSKKHTNPTNENNVLAAGFLYKIGDFTILFDEDSHELKINTSHASKHMKVRPKADNSIEVLACR